MFGLKAKAMEKQRQENLTKVLAALRSGKYRQNFGSLCQRVAGDKDKYSYCAVGVIGQEIRGHILNAYEDADSILKPYGVTSNFVYELNDSHKLSFPEIADRIEELETSRIYEKMKVNV